MSLTAAPPSDPRLDRPYELGQAQIDQFRVDGFIKLKNVFTAEELDEYAEEITRLTLELNPNKDKPLDSLDTYGQAFIQVGSLWTKSEKVKTFDFSRRLARIATELLGTEGVRLWVDQALYKEASGGFTPWHVDQYYWPMSSGLSVTAWIPLQAVPMEMGPLGFGRGTHLGNVGHDLAISDESEELIRRAIAEQGVEEVYEPYELGEVSFHYGWTLHRAGPNTTDRPRKVHCVVYMDKDMRRTEPANEDQQTNGDILTPSTQVDEIMDDPMNPVLYERTWDQED